MPSTVSSYQQGAFVTPVNGGNGDASVVLGNDNALRLKFNSHDADPAIHVQSGTLASRPAAGVACRFWITTDGLRAYLDSGSVWAELAYLPTAGGTVSSSTSAVVGLNTTSGAVSDNTQFTFSRNGTLKWRIGTNISGTNTDRFEVYSDVLAAIAFSITTAGAATFGGALTLTAMGGGTGVVSVGAVDSGGAGFRLLRVPN